MENTKWYQKPVWIIVLLFLFFPVGLFLMWRYSNWNNKAKWAITATFAVLVIIVSLTPATEPTEQETVSKVESKNEATVSAKEKAANEAEAKKKVEEENKEPAPEPDYTKMSVWNTAPKLDTLHYALLTEADSRSNVARILKEIRKNECNKEFCTIFLWGSENAFETAYELNDYKKTPSILDVSGPPAGYWDDDSDSYLYYDEWFKF